jgi:hypothetical protein
VREGGGSSAKDGGDGGRCNVGDAAIREPYRTNGSVSRCRLGPQVLDAADQCKGRICPGVATVRLGKHFTTLPVLLIIKGDR